MKWIDGLKEFNSTKKNWTKSYIKVMKMIKPKTISTNKFKPMMKALRSQA